MVVLAALALTLACDPTGRTDTGVGADITHDPDLVGTWVNVIVERVPQNDDLLRITNRYTFNDDATCVHDRETYSTLADQTYRVEDACTWTGYGGTLTLDYATGATLSFAYRFLNASSGEMILDGFTFRRAN